MHPNKVLLAEANQWPEDVQAYFGHGDECHMAYHFPLMPRIYMAIAQEDRFPITDIMRQTPEIPANCQWAMFLRNHDELTLEMVTDAERDYLWSTYAADPRARINLGIRRRLAPLMDNDRRKIELMNSILMSMPGTPIIYYGDEIGMGDNIYLGDRNGVRTPMQWTPDRNGGFSRADPAALYLPPIMDPVYGYSAVNVEAQSRSLSSLLSWTKRLIGVRKSTKVFGRGTLTFIRPANRAVLAYVRQLGDEAILCVANISRSAQAVELDLSPWKGRIPQEMLGRTRFPAHRRTALSGDAAALWLLLVLRSNSKTEHEPEKVLPRGDHDAGAGGRLGLAAVRLDAQHLRARRAAGFHARPAVVCRQDLAFDQRQGRGRRADRARRRPLRRRHRGRQWRDGTSRYFLPLTIRWTRYTAIDKSPASVLSAVRRGPREGTLLDATAEIEFIAALLAKIHAGRTVGDECTQARIPADRGICGNAGAGDQGRVRIDASSPIPASSRKQRQICREDPPPRHRRHPSGNRDRPVPHRRCAIPECAGSARHGRARRRRQPHGARGRARLHREPGRGLDGRRALRSTASSTSSGCSPTRARRSPETAALLQRMRQIGRRTAEMHLAFASQPRLPDFAPEPIAPGDAARWTDALIERAREPPSRCWSAPENLPEPAKPAGGAPARAAGDHDRAHRCRP